MKYIAILICSSFLFTGCFTIRTLDKAKEDRMPERVKEVLTSYKDSSGNAVIVYKKRNRRPVYKAVLPLDTIVSKFEATGKENLLNKDSTLANFEGVFTVKDQQIILFNNEKRFADTTGLHKEIAKNEHLVEKHKGKTSIPTQDFSMTREKVKTQAVTFTVSDKNGKKYLITFQPKRHMPARYLLVPFTVGLDAVSWPVQIVVGLILLSKIPIS